MLKRHFEHGTYRCEDCGKLTRDTGRTDGTQYGLCDFCHSKEEWFNFVTDGGELEDVPLEFRSAVRAMFAPEDNTPPAVVLHPAYLDTNAAALFGTTVAVVVPDNEETETRPAPRAVPVHAGGTMDKKELEQYGLRVVLEKAVIDGQWHRTTVCNNAGASASYADAIGKRELRNNETGFSYVLNDMQLGWLLSLVNEMLKFFEGKE